MHGEQCGVGVVQDCEPGHPLTFGTLLPGEARFTGKINVCTWQGLTTGSGKAYGKREST